MEKEFKGNVTYGRLQSQELAEHLLHLPALQGSLHAGDTNGYSYIERFIWRGASNASVL
jgi:hypothetical protein